MSDAANEVADDIKRILQALPELIAEAVAKRVEEALEKAIQAPLDKASNSILRCLSCSGGFMTPPQAPRAPAQSRT